jgi:hypothetical protein
VAEVSTWHQPYHPTQVYALGRELAVDAWLCGLRSPLLESAISPTLLTSRGVSDNIA